jgi:rod shape-determining protein MreC
MLDFIRKYRIRILAGIALFAALIFYSLNLRHKEQANTFERAVIFVSSPIVGTVSRVDNFFSSIWDNYLYLVDVEKDNRKLRETVKILNGRLIESREAALDDERLKKLIGLRETLQAPSIAATVIGEDNSPWFKTITIDRGDKDGIREDLPVVASAGVVGRVVKVGGNSSRVLLLTDHASGISAVVQRSRARGIVKGKGGNMCSLEFSERGEDVRIGDVVLTSGVGGVFPKGLPIGEVTMVKKGSYGIFQVVDIRPYVYIPRLEEVLVISRKSEDSQ